MHSGINKSPYELHSISDKEDIESLSDSDWFNTPCPPEVVNSKVEQKVGPDGKSLHAPNCDII